jgi:bifunctional non-homologous end joining protein LigD
MQRSPAFGLMMGGRGMSGKKKSEVLNVAGREVVISNPDKVYFPQAGYSKLRLVQYYLAVADAALRANGDRPVVLRRFVDGAERPAFYQKRAPDRRPDWIDTVTISFPSGRTATEVVLRDAAQLAWVVNLGCIELHPHAIRSSDLDHPDELRIDLDPSPDVGWAEVRQVALLSRDVLAEHGLVSFPKTSGSRGIHLNVRIHPRWSFEQVRRAALALAREVERRAPKLATSAWWKEERHGVFLDYNQNAKDRTTAGAYSVRPTPDARVSTPLTWAEVPDCDPAAFTLVTVPARLAAIGDPAADLDRHPGSLDALLELSERQAAEGQADAPWPPHFPKTADEPPRVQPSRRKARPGAGRKNQALVTVARALEKQDALAGLERWKTRHPDLVDRLGPTDYLVDVMRGRSSTWTRIRVNLAAIPEAERPPAEPPDPDYDPWAAYRGKGPWKPPRLT